MTVKTTSIINVAEAGPEWRWISDLLPDESGFDWRFINARKRGIIENRLPFLHLGRVRAGLEARKCIRLRPADMVLSHGPHVGFYTSWALSHYARSTKHCIFSFNFTDLPSQKRRLAMAAQFKKIDRFAVFSKMEIDLYGSFFDVPKERFDFVRWGVNPPIDKPGSRTIVEPYFVAVGGEARDYATLLEAAKRLPSTRFVFVVRPHSLENLSIPDNVTVKVNLPHQETWSLVYHAEANIVPLRADDTPNGHVTIVGSMHLGKAQIVTNSTGVSDYVEDGNTALLVPARDANAISSAIECLLDQPQLVKKLGSNAQIFARKHCSEQSIVDYFLNLNRIMSC